MIWLRFAIATNDLLEVGLFLLFCSIDAAAPYNDRCILKAP
jgi:hypothetical protein